MYLQHKNKDSLFIKYRNLFFGGEKPAGAHLDAPSLESTYFIYLRHKNKDSVFIKYRTWGKGPWGSALGRTELRKYMFYVFKTQKQRFSIYEI